MVNGPSWLLILTEQGTANGTRAGTETDPNIFRFIVPGVVAIRCSIAHVCWELAGDELVETW